MDWAASRGQELHIHNEATSPFVRDTRDQHSPMGMTRAADMMLQSNSLAGTLKKRNK